MGINTNAIQDYLTWRNNLTESDYPVVFANLALLDEVRALANEGATNEQISSAISELD